MKSKAKAKPKPKGDSPGARKGRRQGKAIPVLQVDRMRIENAREELGLSAPELSRRIGANEKYMYRIESGTVKSTPLLPKIYRALELDPKLINKHDPDVEELIKDYYEIKYADGSAAEAHLRSLRQDAADAKALRERRAQLKAEERAFAARVLKQRRLSDVQ